MMYLSNRGQSHDTRYCVLRYCQKFHPLWIAFENVQNLLTACVVDADVLAKSNFDVVLSWFRNIGYVLCWKILCPTQQRVPARRIRIYFWGFFLADVWYIRLEHQATTISIDQLHNSMVEDGDVLDTADFDCAKGAQVTDTFVATPWPSIFNDVSSDECKWPRYHLQFCEQHGLKLPVVDGPYELSPHVLKSAYPDIALLPQRERDMSKCVHKLVVASDVVGSSIAAAPVGPKVMLDASQALPRKPWTVGMYPTLLPAAKIIDVLKSAVVSPRTLCNLHGIPGIR